MPTRIRWMGRFLLRKGFYLMSRYFSTGVIRKNPSAAFVHIEVLNLDPYGNTLTSDVFAHNWDVINSPTSVLISPTSRQTIPIRNLRFYNVNLSGFSHYEIFLILSFFNNVFINIFETDAAGNKLLTFFSKDLKEMTF